MAAKTQLQKQKYLKCILIILAFVTVAFVYFQVNLPPTEAPVTDINQHRHDYEDILTISKSYMMLASVSEVPRNILGLQVRYVINNPICDPLFKPKDSKDAEVFMVLLTTSHVGGVKKRRALRKILPQTRLDDIKVKRLFLLAKPAPIFNAKYAEVTMKEIQAENEEFHDILMGDFAESYKNLTYKHLMGLEWAATFCQHARFVLKQDDDTVVDYFQLKNMLSGTDLGNFIHNPFHPTIYGKVLENQEVVRDPDSKWFVPEDAYRQQVYPGFVSGWAYITSISAIREILLASANANYLFVDDAFVTGVLREKTSVSLIDMKDYFTTYKGQLLCCVSVPAFAKSKTNEPFWCDYVVGPSNDDLELMEYFQRHSQYCYVSKACRRRDESELLAKKCMITGDMIVKDFASLNSHTTGEPVGRPLPVIRKQ